MPIPTQVKQRAADYASTFGTESGRRVLEDLYRSYGRRPSFSKDALEMAHHEGQRSVYLLIRVMLRIDKMPEEEELDEDNED